MEPLEFYSREDVQKAIFEEAQGKEIGVKYSYGFGKRPEIIFNEADIAEFAKNGATSFHFSEETWNDPLLLSPKITPQEVENNRSGWDLIIDIDTPHFPYSKVAAKYVIEVLKYHGIKNIACKFSGNKGFHIAVPFESFPKKINDKETRTLFPEAPRKIAGYIKGKIQDLVVKEIQKLHSQSEIAENVAKKKEELREMDDIVEIDTVLISSRHLCRMPYSINEKSGLVSIPIDPAEIELFERESAKPENVGKIRPYLLRGENEGEAQGLFVEAFDYAEEKTIFTPSEEDLPKKQDYEDMKDAAPETIFPPSIKKMLEGMEEGKKRSLFVLTHFLASVGWGYDAIHARLLQWNKQNKPPLREVYIQSQLRYFKQHGKKLPPNYDSEMYFSGAGITPTPEEFKAKNPANYTRRKSFILENQKKPKKNAKEDTKQSKNPSGQ